VRSSSWLLAILLAACGGAPQAPAGGAAARVRAALPAYEASAGPERSADRRFDQVRELLRAGRADEARARLEALAADDPSHEAEFLLGYLHHQAERHALALPHFERALAGGPTFPKARQVFFLYGRSLQETGDLVGARAAYEADSRLFPDEADGLYRLALLDLEQGDLPSAESRARACLERFQRPRDRAKAHALLADVHLAREDLPAARAELERCVATFPHYEAFYKLSRVCDRLGEREAAERYLAEHRAWREKAGRDE